MPRTLDDDFQDTASSTVSELDDPKTQPEAQPEKADSPAAKSDDANSSNATGEEDNGLLGVVRDVVDKSRAKSDPASPAEGEEDGSDKQPKKADDENYSDVPFHKHPRFQHLLRKSKTFEQDAVRYQNVQNFLDQNGLVPDEAAEALTVAALAKYNPAAAWERIKPWVQKLLTAAGEVVSPDLQRRVETGELSREAAIEISRHQAKANSLQAEQQFRQQSAEARQQRDQANACLSAAQDWENDRLVKDPHFEAKRELLMKEVAWLQTKEGRPDTPEGVKEQLQKAYRAASAGFTPPAPQAVPQARRPALTPVTSGSVAGNTRTSNMSTLDIVRANRRTG